MPRKGERVRTKVNRFDSVEPSVPLTGEGVILRKLGRHETCDYEVEVDGFGPLCFYISEVRPWKSWNGDDR